MGRAKAARTEVALATFHWQPRSREEWMNEGCRSRPFFPLHSWGSQLGSGAAHCELVFSPPLTWSVQSPTCLPRWPSPRWFHTLSSWQVKLIITGRTWLCLQAGPKLEVIDQGQCGANYYRAHGSASWTRCCTWWIQILLWCVSWCCRGLFVYFENHQSY